MVVQELAGSGSREPTVLISSQLYIKWTPDGNLKLRWKHYTMEIGKCYNQSPPFPLFLS